MALLALCLAVAMLYIVLRLVSMLWRGLEQILNEALSGVRLFCVLTWRATRFAVLAGLFVRCYGRRAGLWASRRAYAALYAWGYVLKRRYIASEIRHVRRMRQS